MSAPNPYAVHALLLVYGADRAEIVKSLRDEADAIERGDDGAFGPTAGAEGMCIVRAGHDGPGGEEAGAAEFWAVYPDNDDSGPSEPIALFADEDEARDYAGESHGDRCVLRAHVALSVWNSYDADPHAAPRAETRGAA